MTILLMAFREVITVYCENCVKDINTVSQASGDRCSWEECCGACKHLMNVSWNNILIHVFV
jgi:hypothetical protein